MRYFKVILKKLNEKTGEYDYNFPDNFDELLDKSENRFMYNQSLKTPHQTQVLRFKNEETVEPVGGNWKEITKEEAENMIRKEKEKDSGNVICKFAGWMKEILVTKKRILG